MLFFCCMLQLCWFAVQHWKWMISSIFRFQLAVLVMKAQGGECLASRSVFIWVAFYSVKDVFPFSAIQVSNDKCEENEDKYLATKRERLGKKPKKNTVYMQKKSSTTNLVTHGYTQPDSFLLVIFLLSSEAAMKMHLFERCFIIACCSFTITLQICAEKWAGWMTIHLMLMNQECAMKSLLKLIISFRNWRCFPDLLLAFSSFSCSSALPLPPFFFYTNYFLIILNLFSYYKASPHMRTSHLTLCIMCINPHETTKLYIW